MARSFFAKGTFNSLSCFVNTIKLQKGIAQQKHQNRPALSQSCVGSPSRMKTALMTGHAAPPPPHPSADDKSRGSGVPSWGGLWLWGLCVYENSEIPKSPSSYFSVVQVLEAVVFPASLLTVSAVLDIHFGSLQDTTTTGFFCQLDREKTPCLGKLAGWRIPSFRAGSWMQKGTMSVRYKIKTPHNQP